MACPFMLAPLSSGQLESQSAIRVNPRFNLSAKRSRAAAAMTGRIVRCVFMLLFP